MLEFLATPLGTYVFGTLLVVVGIVAVYLFRKHLVPLIEANEWYASNRLVLENISQVVSDVVLRIAFAHEDLSDFEEEAKATGRDVRLVAAIYLVNKWTNEHGIELDEEDVITRIEAWLARHKAEGIIPSKPVLEAVEGEPQTFDATLNFDAESPLFGHFSAVPQLDFTEDDGFGDDPEVHG